LNTFAKYSRRVQKAWEKGMPINLRCFEEVEWDKIEVKKGHWKDIEPKYEVQWDTGSFGESLDVV
jgi:hypothetical protein